MVHGHVMNLTRYFRNDFRHSRENGISMESNKNNDGTSENECEETGAKETNGESRIATTRRRRECERTGTKKRKMKGESRVRKGSRVAEMDMNGLKVRANGCDERVVLDETGRSVKGCNGERANEP